MFDPPPFAGPVGATSADLEEEEDDDDDDERAGPSRSAVRRVARREARRSSPYVAASGREGSAAGPSSWNQGGSPFFGRSTGMVQPLAEGQLTPPPGHEARACVCPLTAGGAKMLTSIATGGGSPVKSTTSGSPVLPGALRVPASTRNQGLFLSKSSTSDESGSVCVPRDVTSTMRPGIVPSRIAGPAMTCDTTRLARRVGTGSTDYKVLIKKLRDASTRVSSATTPAHCGAGV